MMGLPPVSPFAPICSNSIMEVATLEEISGLKSAAFKELLESLDVMHCAVVKAAKKMRNQGKNCC
jgi:hypothetical protein